MLDRVVDVGVLVMPIRVCDGAHEGIMRLIVQWVRDQRGSDPGPYRRIIQDGEGPEGVGSRTIQEGHTRRRGTRGSQVQDHTGGPYNGRGAEEKGGGGQRGGG